MNLRLLVVVLGCLAVLWSAKRWKLALEAALILVVLEGAIRKWVVPGAQDLVYFGKDAILLGVYWGFFNSAERHRLKAPVSQALVIAIAVSAGLGAFQIFNPNLPNLWVGLLGFKAYFLYLPLLWVVPAAFNNDGELARFLKRQIWLAIPVGLLAAAQFYSPQDSPLNVYARPSTTTGYVTTFGSSRQVRVTGTFSYITGFASYVLTMAIVILARLAATRWRFRGNLDTYAALVLTLMGMLMSGSRGPVYMLFLLLPLYWWLGLRGGQGATALGRFLLGLGLVAVLLNYTGSEAIEAFYGRASGAYDTFDRVEAPLTAPLEALDYAGIAGYGIGATHQTAAAVTKGIAPFSWLPYVTEAEPGQVMLELGALGFLAIYILRLLLIVVAARYAFRLRTAFHRALATSSLLFFLAHLPGGVISNVTAGVFYGFFAGLLMAAVRLDQAAAVPARSPARRPAYGPGRLRPLAGRPALPRAPVPAAQVPQALDSRAGSPQIELWPASEP